MVVSKPAAAAWAARRLGRPWPALVERALGWRTDERPDDRQLPETMRFVAHAVELARSAGSSPGRLSGGGPGRRRR